MRVCLLFQFGPFDILYIFVCTLLLVLIVHVFHCQFIYAYETEWVETYLDDRYGRIVKDGQRLTQMIFIGQNEAGR